MAEVGTTTLGTTREVGVRIGAEWFSAKRYQWDCVSDASGNLSAGPGHTINGKVAQVHFVPDSGGTQPSDAFDVTMPESLGGVDILQGVGANVSQTATTAANIRTPLTTDSGFIMLVEQSVTVSASNVGNAKGFTVYLTVLP